MKLKRTGPYRRIYPAAAGAAAVIVAFIAGVLWQGGTGGRPESRTDEPAAESASSQMYYCSMHPQVRSPDPNDKCPICFMDLIPLPDDDDDPADESDVPRLRLSSRAAALMEIRTWPAERRPVEIRVRLFGKIDFDERRLYNIPVRTDAYVERLFVNTPWQTVAEGDVLADLYSPEAITAMHELLTVLKGAVGERPGLAGNTTAEAARSRLRRMGVTNRQIEEIERSGEAPRTFRAESPVSGAVLSIEAREGGFLREGGLLARIADLSQVWVHLEAYERDLAGLANGQTVRFTVQALPGREFEGTVTFIEPVINSRSRTVRLRIEADNSDGLLKPGMFASAYAAVSYSSPSAPEAQPYPLVVPASAPLITGKRALVYVRVPGEDRPVFEPRRVTLGPRAGDFYVVEEGLAEGDLVVVNGQFKIDSELQIRGRPSMMAPEGDAPQTHDHHGHAHPQAHDDEARDTPRLQTECPVMGGAINTDFYVDVKGFRVFVCCPGCDQAVLDDPETYLEKMKAEGITPYRLQTHCPVMGGEINRDLYHDHAGQRIYVCCPGCLDEIRERTDDIIEEQRRHGIVFEKSPDNGE